MKKKHKMLCQRHFLQKRFWPLQDKTNISKCIKYWEIYNVNKLWPSLPLQAWLPLYKEESGGQAEHGDGAEQRTESIHTGDRQVMFVP